MRVKELIEALSKMPQDMPVGATNYYGTFGTAESVEVETGSSESWHKASYDGQKVVVIHFNLDLQ